MSSRFGSTGKGTSLDELKEAVKRDLERELNNESSSEVVTSDYKQFRADNLPAHHSFYERACLFAGSIVKLSSSPNPKLERALATAHLSCSVSDVLALSVLAPFALWLLMLLLTVLIPFAFFGSLSLYFFMFSTIVALLSYFPLANMPYYLASVWRQRASNQMVLAVFYIVTYMRHTPNLELAIQFASSHIGPPLSLDLKKVLWDVETHKFKSVIDSLEDYLSFWRGDAREFIESLHLIEASLYEKSDDRRLNSLDKSLEIILEETYEKMLHYAQNLKGPITMLHMLGIILPVLGLVILPLAVSFLGTHWSIISSLYNFLLPAFVFYLGKKVLVTRPTGYGTSESALTPVVKSSKKLSPFALAFSLGVAFVFIGVSPLIMHAIGVPDVAFPDPQEGPYYLLQYEVDSEGNLKGPFGLGAGILSLFFTLGVGLSLGLYYKLKTKDLIEFRKKTKDLESEFASALFQLGNRIGEGIPVEIAFSKVSFTMEGTVAGEFFSHVAQNIQRLGMGVEEAIFHPSHGALRFYPSPLIESSMKVLVESAKKGPAEASKALMSMSTYIHELHRVDERLKDLLTDVLSSMKTQVKFLLPTIAGVVIGITSLITVVLVEIQNKTSSFESASVNNSFSDLFGLGIPTFFFQIIVGLYVVQVTWILSYLISGIENGVDPLGEQAVKGNSLFMSTLMYSGIAFVIILAFNLLAGALIKGF